MRGCERYLPTAARGAERRARNAWPFALRPPKGWSRDCRKLRRPFASGIGGWRVPVGARWRRGWLGGRLTPCLRLRPRPNPLLTNRKAPPRARPIAARRGPRPRVRPCGRAARMSRRVLRRILSACATTAIRGARAAAVWRRATSAVSAIPMPMRRRLRLTRAGRRPEKPGAEGPARGGHARSETGSLSRGHPVTPDLGPEFGERVGGQFRACGTRRPGVVRAKIAFRTGVH